VAGILHGLAGTVGHLSGVFDGVFGSIGHAGLGASLTKAFLGGFFHGLVAWVADGAASLIAVLGTTLSSSTEPVIAGSAWHAEFGVMAVLGASVALPLLALGAIQAIARQDPGELLRSALVRLPLALLFTGVAVQLVALGLAATDEASAMVLHSAAVPTHHLLRGLVAALADVGGLHLAGFGAFLVVLCAAVVAFVLWLELAVRSAAIAAAALFLPLALAGLARPATSHWARRLGETLAALVVSKLVIAAVLALAAGMLGSSSGLPGVVEGLALLAMAAAAPFALLRLVPAIESGAAAHLEGLGRRAPRSAQRIRASAAGAFAGGEGLAADGLGASGGLGAGAGTGSQTGLSVIGAGPFGSDRSQGAFGEQVASWDAIFAEAASSGDAAGGAGAASRPPGGTRRSSPPRAEVADRE